MEEIGPGFAGGGPWSCQYAVKEDGGGVDHVVGGVCVGDALDQVGGGSEDGDVGCSS